MNGFEEKAKAFNFIFAKQWSIINSCSSFLLEMIDRKENCLSSVQFSTENILKTLENVDWNKVLGNNKISIIKLEIYSFFICEQLQTICKPYS